MNTIFFTMVNRTILLFNIDKLFDQIKTEGGSKPPFFFHLLKTEAKYSVCCLGKFGFK